jgi:hypothetical protein
MSEDLSKLRHTYLLTQVFYFSLHSIDVNGLRVVFCGSKKKDTFYGTTHTLQPGIHTTFLEPMVSHRYECGASC